VIERLLSRRKRRIQFLDSASDNLPPASRA
jgi:hypothetical protein